MRDYILSQISRLQRAISDLAKQADRIERQRIEIRAEMRAYEDMLGHLSGDNESASYKSSATLHVNGRAGQVRDSNWRGVFEYIAREWPKAVTTDGMVTYAAASGLSLTRQAIRAQTSTYTQRGSLERVATGVYRITPKGASELGMSLEDNSTEKVAAAPSLFEESAADSTQHDAESGRVVAG